MPPLVRALLVVSGHFTLTPPKLIHWHNQLLEKIFLADIMAYSSTAVRYFTAPRALSDAMDDLNTLRHDSEPRTTGRPNPTAMDTLTSSEAPNSKPIAAPSPAPVPALTAPERAPKENGLTYANQHNLPKLPIPDLESTCRKYLESLSPLQSPGEHEDTKAAVQDFLRTDGPVLQDKLKNYAHSQTSYIEQFCKFLCCMS